MTKYPPHEPRYGSLQSKDTQPGRVETRFRWLIEQLEARLPEAKTKFSSRPPELTLLEALDARLAQIHNAEVSGRPSGRSA